MMGQRTQDQGKLFYSFDLNAAVPDDHLVRKISAVLDLSWVHAELAPHYSHTGRPSIDPVLMIRMLVIGYVFAIRSERALCREVQVNLAYWWFCGLGIEDPRSFGLHTRTQRAFPCVRHFPPGVRTRRRLLHQGRSGRWQRLRRRCEPDRS